MITLLYQADLIIDVGGASFSYVEMGDRGLRDSVSSTLDREGATASLSGGCFVSMSMSGLHSGNPFGGMESLEWHDLVVSLSGYGAEGGSPLSPLDYIR